VNELIETGPSKDECNLAMLAHLLGAFTGFVGALILWLVKKDDGGFVAQEEKKALNVKAVVARAWAPTPLLKIILIGFLLFPFIFVANFIFCILAALSATKGKAYRYPFALRLVN
jgi:uncharacterized protein